MILRIEYEMTKSVKIHENSFKIRIQRSFVNLLTFTR